MRALKAAGTPETPPDVEVTRAVASPLTDTRLVFFQQVHARIPIFGSHAVVELDRDGKPVGASAEVAGMGDVPTTPTLGVSGAQSALAAELRVPAGQIPESTELRFYQTGPAEGMRLVWLFREVPAAPVEARLALSSAPCDGHGLGPSPRQHEFSFDYLVDAGDGRVHFSYSRTPLVKAPPPPVPVECDAIDDEGNPQKIYVSARAEGDGYELWDAFKRRRTFDLAGELLDSPVPVAPAGNGTATWPPAAGAAVSAHVNAGIVNDFYRSVLMRDGIDDGAMVVESVVNCSYLTPGEWHNAVWMKNRMWYGRAAKEGGGYRSYARYLDVVAHELTHGVTERTSGLVYKDQSGALNESFSDIFGIIIKNCNPVPKDTVEGWDWQIGRGLGKDGKPIRDLARPEDLGYPRSAANYAPLAGDAGGVHYWSNVPNLAAYLVLTTQDAGAYLFSPREVAVLYYLTLTRLDPLATFSKARAVLLDVARTYYGDPEVRAKKTAAIAAAYTAVGIE